VYSIFLHIHTHTCIYIYIYIYTYVYAHTHTHTHTHILHPRPAAGSACGSGETSVQGVTMSCVFYISAHTHTHMHIFTYIYICSLSLSHTHTHMLHPRPAAGSACGSGETGVQHVRMSCDTAHRTRHCHTLHTRRPTARSAAARHSHTILRHSSPHASPPYPPPHMNQTCHTTLYEWGLSHMNEACHVWMRLVTHEYDIAWMSHVTYEHERVACERERVTYDQTQKSNTHSFSECKKKKKIYAFVLGVFRIVTSDSFVFICDMTHSYDVRFIWLIIDIIYEYHVTWIQHVTWVRHHMNIMSHEYNMCTTSDTACVRGRIQSRGGIHSRDVAWHDLFTSCLIHMTHSRHHIWISCHMNTTSDMNIISHDVVFVWLFCSRRNT